MKWATTPSINHAVRKLQSMALSGSVCQWLNSVQCWQLCVVSKLKESPEAKQLDQFEQWPMKTKKWNEYRWTNTRVYNNNNHVWRSYRVWYSFSHQLRLSMEHHGGQYHRSMQVGVSQPKSFVSTALKLGYSSGEGADGFQTTAEWSWALYTSWDLHYFYFSVPNPR